MAKGPPNLSNNYYGGGIVYRRGQWSGTNFSWADTGWFSLSTSTNYQDYYDLDGTNITALPTNQALAVGRHAVKIDGGLEGTTNGIAAPQPLSAMVGLWGVGSRLAISTIRNGFLWTCQAIGLSTNGTYNGDSSGSSVSRSGMQWLKLQISPDSSTLSLADHGRIFDSSQSDHPWWYYYPSLMVNCGGDMVAGFFGSTSTNYISAFYTWRAASGFMLTQPALLQSGTVTNDSRTVGDYSATTLDPTDGWSFGPCKSTLAALRDSIGGER